MIREIVLTKQYQEDPSKENEMEGTWQCFGATTPEKRPPERPTDKWTDISKMDLRNRMGGRGRD